MNISSISSRCPAKDKTKHQQWLVSFPLHSVWCMLRSQAAEYQPGVTGSKCTARPSLCVGPCYSLAVSRRWMHKRYTHHQNIIRRKRSSQKQQAILYTPHNSYEFDFFGRSMENAHLVSGKNEMHILYLRCACKSELSALFNRHCSKLSMSKSGFIAFRVL